MNDLVKIIKDKPLFIPRILFNNYKKMGISDSELVIITLLISYGDKVIYDPEVFVKEIGGNKREIMKIIDNLCDKNILSLVIEKNNKKSYECISLDLLYDKLFNIIIQDDDKKMPIDESVFSVFESELGRTLSPMEYEKIKEWITSGNSKELIILALREAVLNGVSNLNYIDSILNSWKKKGYKNKSDILKDKENYREKKENVKVFEMDWLNE